MDQLPRLGKRELICLLLFTCNYVVSVWRGFLFFWVLGMGYVILLWHSLSLPLIIFHEDKRDRGGRDREREKDIDKQHEELIQVDRVYVYEERLRCYRSARVCPSRDACSVRSRQIIIMLTLLCK